MEPAFREKAIHGVPGSDGRDCIRVGGEPEMDAMKGTGRHGPWPGGYVRP